MNSADIQPQSGSLPQGSSKAERLILSGMWLIAISSVLLAVYVGWWVRSGIAAPAEPEAALAQIGASPTLAPQPLGLPSYDPQVFVDAIPRRAITHTIIPNRPRQEVVNYTVSMGDSVFSIAQKFAIKPETVLWANYDLLQDSPDTLSLGMNLNIPPVDGVYYKWQTGDTLEVVAVRFEARKDEILGFPGNKLDLAEPQINPGDWVMVPGGHREFRSWIVPTIARGQAGVSKAVYGPGACEGNYEGVYGTGGFIWPSANRHLSGNDFWSGHLGIDIAAGTGDAVFASDSGVVVFAGWATGGYGNMIMIDHGNGYQSVYAHLSQTNVRCGQSVFQGGYIGASGSTGNSTGSHLHFEIRLWGQFVNPWHVLP